MKYFYFKFSYKKKMLLLNSLKNSIHFIKEMHAKTKVNIYLIILIFLINSLPKFLTFNFDKKKPYLLHFLIFKYISKSIMTSRKKNLNSLEFLKEKGKLQTKKLILLSNLNENLHENEKNEEKKYQCRISQLKAAIEKVSQDNFKIKTELIKHKNLKASKNYGSMN